jgi:hypothetical protein
MQGGVSIRIQDAEKRRIAGTDVSMGQRRWKVERKQPVVRRLHEDQERIGGTFSVAQSHRYSAQDPGALGPAPTTPQPSHGLKAFPLGLDPP